MVYITRAFLCKCQSQALTKLKREGVCLVKSEEAKT